jgi:hypothetical protein
MTVAEQVQAERELGETLADFAGKWVAVRDYEVMASADSLGGLLEQIEGEPQGEETTVFQVQDRDVVCFY